MGNLDSEGSDTDLDLESGGTTSEEDGRIVPDLSAEHGKKVLRRTWSGFVGLNRSARVGNGLNSYDEVSISGRASADNVNIISDQLARDVDSLEKKISREKKKTSNSKNPSKPPRPPKGPLLDAADMKFVKEFSELARLKRRRVERMNKLKKKKSEQESSSCSNVIAMVVTCVFGFVIIFHGLLGSNV
ncbi:hypothetical protein DCAR_0729038 [Daucus carota subsp. sativus]|uniref:Transmembrane protein n=1 Tax=Daucus carota subsp. sativus TaxID=79200 RepID=A0AAF0XKR9_DAUCS|nr:PREDICTED: uncharacterized protein LOC108193966 [Daucus carota subsp. sativus]XP_017216320.1 PREDICTED: uncharacterized protein LOC108193966 [Daucus carota subsp. sativus]WOH09580.1 hypothetical protein DCAR_0729038 [Daucus carota subsp. sativus]